MAKKIKTYVITISETFPKGHISQGKETSFVHLIRRKLKIHTIRGNFDFWAKRFNEIKKGNAVLSVRVWEGQPYNSGQREVFQFSHKDNIGIEKLDLTQLGFFVDDLENDLTVSDLAKNDGLSKGDFVDWFNGKIVVGMPSKAIIHFTNFRYKKKVNNNESYFRKSDY